MSNKMMKGLQSLNKFPESVQKFLITKTLSRMIPFVGTAKIKFVKVSEDGVIATLPNKRSNQNHISSVHAAATALLAETVSGISMGAFLPDDKLPLLKEMNVKYIKRTEGDLRGEASISEEDKKRIMSEDKGDVAIDVKITDAAGNETNIVTMTWAWIPKKRK